MSRPASEGTDTGVAPGARATSIARRVLAWLPSILWAGFIFGMSTDGMSAERTRFWVEPIVRFMVPSLSAGTIELVHEVVRKLAHVGEYFVFFLALEYGFRHGSNVRAGAVPASALGVAALYSLTDEGHQLLVASRTASLHDCVLDTFGAALAAVGGRFGLPLPR